MTYTSASGSKPTLPPPPYAPADFERGVTGREAWAPERRDKVEDSKRKDNACTKNHENSCGQDALLILWAWRSHCTFPYFPAAFTSLTWPKD
jgi:hypothetical protein